MYGRADPWHTLNSRHRLYTATGKIMCGKRHRPEISKVSHLGMILWGDGGPVTLSNT